MIQFWTFVYFALPNFQQLVRERILNELCKTLFLEMDPILWYLSESACICELPSYVVLRNFLNGAAVCNLQRSNCNCILYKVTASFSPIKTICLYLSYFSFYRAKLKLKLKTFVIMKRELEWINLTDKMVA